MTSTADVLDKQSLTDNVEDVIHDQTPADVRLSGYGSRVSDLC
jgi:hypothetical protein